VFFAINASSCFHQKESAKKGEGSGEKLQQLHHERREPIVRQLVALKQQI